MNTMEHTPQSAPTSQQADKPFRRGCGCLLLVVGIIMVLFAIFIGVAGCVADKDAGAKNDAEWAEYNTNMPIIDSLYEAGVPDSIIDARYPRPMIRQGGFATIFGGFFAFVILFVAAIPVTVGLILMKKKRKE